MTYRDSYTSFILANLAIRNGTANHKETIVKLSKYPIKETITSVEIFKKLAFGLGSWTSGVFKGLRSSCSPWS